MRKIAVHELIVEDDALHDRVEEVEAKPHDMEMAVIEISDGIVTDYYPFTDEQPQTEWIGGTVILRRNKQGLIQAFKNNRLLC